MRLVEQIRGYSRRITTIRFWKLFSEMLGASASKLEKWGKTAYISREFWVSMFVRDSIERTPHRVMMKDTLSGFFDSAPISIIAKSSTRRSAQK